MMMKIFRVIRLVALALSAILFVSCLPQISIKAGADDDATIFFSTGFSESAAKTLQAISGVNSDSPLFNKEDVLLILKSAGAENTSVSIPSKTEIAATGTIRHISQSTLSKTGILTKTEKSLRLTLGPKQIAAFYDLLDDDAKSYLDLMMIPALISEKMTVSEYREILSSMYGPTFADEIVNGRLTIQLSSADGKKRTKNTLTLGELLTALGDIVFEI